jgi:hypothetical protein
LSPPSEFHAGIEQVEALIRTLETNADEKTLAAARELVQALLRLHGAGFVRLLKMLETSGESGRGLALAIREDSLLSSLLLLHGLHPLPIEARVDEAVSAARQQIILLGGTCDFVSMHEGTARVHLSAPSGPAAAAIRRILEESIDERAPDIARLIIEGLEPRPHKETAAASGLITIRLPSERGP